MCDKDCGGYWWYVSGIVDVLIVDFVEGIFVIGDVVDEDFVGFVILCVFDQIVDVGFVFVICCKVGGIGQYGFDQFQWYDFKFFGGGYGFF